MGIVEREQPAPASAVGNVTGSGPPGWARVHALVPHRLIGAVLLPLEGEAQDPHWSPLAAARRLVAHVNGDLNLLYATRARLREPQAARSLGGGHAARVQVTLHIAIADLEESGQTASPEAG